MIHDGATPATAHTDLPAVTEAIIEAFPALSGDEPRVAVELYRLLGRGNAVTVSDLAQTVGVAPERVEAMLAAWPGVERDGAAITGFWGLSVGAPTKHRLTVNGNTLYTWCAWDTLFLPQVLDTTCEVTSTCPRTGETVRLTVSPRGVERVEPEGTVLSFVVPDREQVREDVRSAFCRHVHFLTSLKEGALFCAEQPGRFLLSLEEGVRVGHARNDARLAPALPPRAIPTP